jgi:conjugative transfer region protein (TIGR03748 family)
MQMQSLRVQGLVGMLALVLASGAVAQTKLVDGGTQVQVGRYTTQAARPAPDVQEPLEIYAQLSFPRSVVRTVGDALRHTLMRTGYALVSEDLLSEDARHFMTLPLPESQRELGPYQVKDILKVVVGKAWRLQHDPVKRLVWFELANPAPNAAIPTGTQPAVAAAPPPPAPAPAPQADPINRSQADQYEFYVN